LATARKFGPADVAQSLQRRARAGAATPAARIWLALGTVYLLWGSTYLGIKFAIDTIPPLLMGSLRFLVAGGVLYALAARGGGASRDRLGATQWGAALLIGAALLLGGNGGVILAEQYAPTGVVALLVATAPLWMAIIDRVAFGRRLPPLVIVGLVVGFGGVAFLIGSPGSGHVRLIGAALALAAPICWASGSVFTRHVKLPLRPLMAAAMEMLWAGVLFGIASLVTGEFGRLPIAQGKDGRDHNRQAFSLWIAGGGFKKGYVHGATDEFGGKSIQDTIRVYDLHATLLHVLGLDHTKLSFPHEGRQDTLTDVAVTDAEVNKALLA